MKPFFSRGFFMLSLFGLLFLLSGCPEPLLPEMVFYNTFELDKQWRDRYLGAIEVYHLEDEEPVLVWKICATETTPAEGFVFQAGIIPDGFVQKIPRPPKRFIPQDGHFYFTTVFVDPCDPNISNTALLWRASSPPLIDTPADWNDVYVHPYSGMKFPSMAGLFVRGPVRKYDPQGRDISVAYEIQHIGGNTEMTVFIFPSAHDRNFPGHFEQACEAVLRFSRSSKLLIKKDVAIKQNGHVYRGKRATFSMQSVFSGQKIATLSLLYLFKYGDWYIKYRVTYPQTGHDKIMPEIERFMQELSWPEK